MTGTGAELTPVSDDELGSVYGGRSFWGWVKAGAKWAKDHVKATLHSIGIGGKF